MEEPSTIEQVTAAPTPDNLQPQSALDRRMATYRSQLQAVIPGIVGALPPGFDTEAFIKRVQAEGEANVRREHEAANNEDPLRRIQRAMAETAQDENERELAEILSGNLERERRQTAGDHNFQKNKNAHLIVLAGSYPPDGNRPIIRLESGFAERILRHPAIGVLREDQTFEDDIVHGKYDQYPSTETHEGVWKNDYDGMVHNLPTNMEVAGHRITVNVAYKGTRERGKAISVNFPKPAAQKIAAFRG